MGNWRRENDSQSLPASSVDKKQPRTILPVSDDRKISFRGAAPYALRQIKVRAVAAVRFVGIFVGIGDQTFTANFAIPNEGIEQIARKNDGASANPNTSTGAPPDLL
jgi:hypothetical protein